jgi:hypothetical protein
MQPIEDTRIRFLTELRDSDDIKIMAKAGDIGKVTCSFDDHVLARLVTGGVEFATFEDEYEVLP